MKDWLKRLLAKKELEELHRWRLHWDSYRRWLAEFPEIAITLDNLKTEVDGKVSLDACHPPGKKGPWTIQGLRYCLRELYKGKNNER